MLRSRKCKATSIMLKVGVVGPRNSLRVFVLLAACTLGGICNVHVRARSPPKDVCGSIFSSLDACTEVMTSKWQGHRGFDRLPLTKRLRGGREDGGDTIGTALEKERQDGAMQANEDLGEGEEKPKDEGNAGGQQLTMKERTGRGVESWMDFELARDLVQRQGFSRKREYALWRARPKNLPPNPNKAYEEHGWAGWSNFLGKTSDFVQPATAAAHGTEQVGKSTWLKCGECHGSAVMGVASVNLTGWDLLLCRSCEKRLRMGGKWRRDHSVSVNSTGGAELMRLPLERKRIKLLYRRCFECPQFASFGPMPAHIEYPQARKGGSKEAVLRPWHCRKHAFEGEVDVIHNFMRCMSQNCTKIASFGPRGGKAVACKDHMLSTHVGLQGYYCKHPEGCTIRAVYGPIGSGKPLYCSKHCSSSDVQYSKFRCMFPEGCFKQATFKSMVTPGYFCKRHRGANYTMIWNRKPPKYGPAKVGIVRRPQRRRVVPFEDEQKIVKSVEHGSDLARNATSGQNH